MVPAYVEPVAMSRYLYGIDVTAFDSLDCTRSSRLPGLTATAAPSTNRFLDRGMRPVRLDMCPGSTNARSTPGVYSK